MTASPGRIVLDASAGLPLVLEERLSRGARRLSASWAAGGAELIVPALFWIEVANTLVRYLPAQEAVAEALHNLDRLGLRTVPIDRALLLLAVGEAQAAGLSLYDALYLAVAEAEDGRLATADRALAAAAGDRAILLGDHSGGVHEGQATYGSPPRTPGDTDPDAWPGFDGYVARLREESLKAS